MESEKNEFARDGKRKAESPAPNAAKRRVSNIAAHLSNERDGGDGNGEEHMEVDEGDGESSDEEIEVGEDEGDWPGEEDGSEEEFGFYDDEEEGPSETEVEEREISPGASIPGTVTIKLFLYDEDPEFSSWMQTIHVKYSLDGKEIGRGFGRFVKRGLIASNFWRDMEEPCQELSTVAFEVFDRYGRLKQEFKDHVVRKGTGAWGDELDTGNLFIIEYVRVNKEWRRKGVGKAMMTALLAKACSNNRQVAFHLVVPGILNNDIRDDQEGKTKKEQREIRFHAHDNATAFCRSLGFRRIGASSCFGIPVTDPSHKAYLVAFDGDFDPADPEDEPEDDMPASGAFAASHSFGNSEARSEKISKHLEMLKERLPLHHAVATLSDRDCVKFFQTITDADTWKKVDRSHNNVLHLAAGEFKVESAKWLMRHFKDTLGIARDIKGYTPLEALIAQLETKRNTLEHGMMTICISDKFSGYPDVAVQCISALNGIENPTREQLLQFKYGCTGGECIDGFLSPRMKYALLCQAEVCYDMLRMEVDDAESWAFTSDFMTEHVAEYIRRNFLTNKSLRRGYTNILDHIAIALRANTPPTIENVLEVWRDSGEWPPCTRNFYERGGNAESALRFVFESARDQNEWSGDGEHMAVFEDEVNKLPKCRNDDEFGFVALACGVADL